jgi:gliding motility-associated lipoprotein GldH
MLQLKWLIGLFTLTLIGCSVNGRNIITHTLNGNTWHRNNNLQFNFCIQDATQPYDIYLLIKDTPAYPYQNFYITYYLKDTQSTVLTTELKNYLLFDPKTGKPLGKGWSKNKNHELILLKNYYFSKPGDYTVELAQFMRTEALLGIHTVGIKICKADSATI